MVAAALAEEFAQPARVTGSEAGTGSGAGSGSGAVPAAPWFRVHPRQPHTHQFQVWLPYDARVLNEAAVRQAEETGVVLFRRWFDSGSGPPGVSVTEVTVAQAGLEWTADDVRQAVREFMARVKAEAGAETQAG